MSECVCACAQVRKAANHHRMSLLDFVKHGPDPLGVAVSVCARVYQLIMLVPLAYMSFCTYRSLVLFKLPCVRVRVHTHTHTHTHSLTHPHTHTLTHPLTHSLTH